MLGVGGWQGCLQLGKVGVGNEPDAWEASSPAFRGLGF